MSPLKVPHFQQKKSHLARTTRESTWTTCRATCHRHIMREFLLKKGNKSEGTKMATKKSEGMLRKTKIFFFWP